MSTAATRERLAQRVELADAHVLRGREIVARQLALITWLKARHLDCADAERLLTSFEGALTIFEEHRAELLDRIKSAEVPRIAGD